MPKKSISYAKYGYLFSIPFVLAFLVFWLYPILYTLIIGFTDLRGLTKTDINFLPDIFGNFKSILANATFRKSLSNTFLIWFMNFIPQIGIALLLTAWFTNLNFKIRGQGAFKVLFYMPNIMTAATIAILFNVLFGYPKGPINDILIGLGLQDSPVYYLIHSWTARGVVAYIQFWMWYGNTLIVLIGGVMGINPGLFEAARIDGASSSQIFFRVTLPSLRTILLFTLVTSLVGGLNMFDISKLFLLGGPDNSTLTASVFIYNQAFSGSFLYNRAAAASMIMFVIIVFFSAILFFILRDKDEAKLNKQKREEKRAEKAMRRAAV